MQPTANGTDRDRMLADLERASKDGTAALQQLVLDGIPLQADVNQVLAPMPEATVTALRANQTISTQPEVYARALDSLLTRNGHPPSQPAPPDVDRAKTELVTAEDVIAKAPALSSQTNAPTGNANSDAINPATSTTPASSSDSVNWTFIEILALIAAALLGAGFVAIYLQRRHRNEARPIGELLEVSRRLTAATATGEVDRAAVREAIGLVNASAAALVRRTDQQSFVVGYESQDDLLVEDRLGDGVIGRAAETGQPITQISATEPAIRNLPVSLAVVPLVVRGSVEAVLVVVRRENDPFSQAERDLLASLAPVTATALHSESQAQAAVENSLLDPLTGAGNRRRLDAELPDVLRDGANRPASLIMIDLDHFKRVNDSHGHPAGDALLRGVVDVIRQTVRPGDRVYRYGGEEFSVLLPSTDIEEAIEVAERMRRAVAGTAFDAGLDAPLNATASFGVAVTADDDASGLISMADAALYDAKQAGRDRVASAR